MNEIHVRASSVPDFFDCAARWYAKNILRMSTTISSNGHLGQSIHKATEVFDAGLVEHNHVTVDEALEAFVTALQYPERDVEWDIPAEKLEPIGLALVDNYCKNVAHTQNYVAVEAFCDSLRVRFDDPGITLVLSGTTDRIRESDDGQRLGVVDLKSGKNAVRADNTVSKQGHHLQLAVYEILAEEILKQPITEPARIIGLQTNSKARVAHVDVPHARTTLIGTENEPGALESMARMMKIGMFPGNPKSMMCHEKYCPAWAGCKWRGR